MTTSSFSGRSETAQLTILGSGTSTGVPMVGCSCPVCLSNDPKDNRTRCSALITFRDLNILIDTSSDLRSQALREKIARIDAVLFTHAHADHVNGIDDLRGFHFIHHEVIPCFVPKPAFDDLLSRFSYVFREKPGSGYPPLLKPFLVDGVVEIEEVQIVPVPLRHGKGVSTGYRIGDICYLTDCNGIPAASEKLLKGVRVVIIDGLRWSPHPSHFSIETAIAAAAGLAPERIVLTHITHEVSHADAVKLPGGVELAYDGMKFGIDLQLREMR